MGSDVYIAIVLCPLLASLVAGLGGRLLGRAIAHTVAIAAVGVSFVLSVMVLREQLAPGSEVFNETIYTWLLTGGVHIQVGFLVDPLTALMITVVTFVSLMVHIYTIGYMADDPGYQRFFSHIALFTFAMLMLVMANNFMQLFFGWEGVGLVSYLLIGFWYKRPTAVFASLKAFMINRVGDFSFVVGIAMVLAYTGSLDYQQVFAQAEALGGMEIEIFSGTGWSVATVTCLLLFVGAMAKSAQMPLHGWLPDSMEGPTPISALIHAATMVTAGVFMVARMSPLFEQSEVALTVVLVIGATTALLTGFVGVVQNDIKRVVAYSTLSQLGYMTAALGVSAYAASIFHLMTHAFFKALLFLTAGSVIVALHHEQDMRKMGGLRRYMPITYWTTLIGSLALIGFPGFSGFFSKDAIIEAVQAASIPGSGFALFCLMIGVFVTALYSFRLFFLVFHGEERLDVELRGQVRESPLVITVPLILLAVASIASGWPFIGPVVFGDYFGTSIVVSEGHAVLEQLGAGFHGPGGFLLHGLLGLPLLLSAAGVGAAWYAYMKDPALPGRLRDRASAVYTLLANKYYLDDLNEKIIMRGTRGVGQLLWRIGDVFLIDGAVVNGSAWVIDWFSGRMRRGQTGYLYHYAFAMVIGLSILLGWLLFKGA